MLKRIPALYLIPVILFLFLAAPEFVQRSMYNDGIWYAILGKNMANGVGNFWYPHLTTTIFPSFHEHPPLVFGMLSLFYTLLGDSILVERIYAFIIFLLTALAIVNIWKYCWKKNPELQGFWFIPLSFWLLNEIVYHFYPANVLEPTLGLFTIVAVSLLFRSSYQDRQLSVILSLLLASVCIIGATLSKGFVGLFPLATLGIHWLILRQLDLWDTIVRTLIILGTLIIGYIFILSFPTASDSLQQYLDSQVMASISEERTTYHHRENRLYIIGRLFQVLLPAIGLTFILFQITVRKFKVKPTSTTIRTALFFIVVGISASFPLIVSPKQSFYYLLPSVPYFVIGLSLLVAPGIATMVSTLQLSKGTISTLHITVLLLFVGGLAFAGSKIGTIDKRDQRVLHDVERITKVVPPGTTIGSKGYTAHLLGYLYRNHEINIDTNFFNYPYLIIDGDKDIAEPKNFKKIFPDTRRFHLYEQE